ncbi:MAG: PTS sugar transporter subunit IIA, partial [Vagococcus sp.]
SFDLDGQNFLEVATNVSKKLEQLDLIEPTYLDAVITRENTFPTGLITKSINISIPHTDSEHVKEPFVYIVRCENDISVKQMGDNQEMTVSNFFFLGIKDPKKQVELLQVIMNLFMDDQFVRDYVECSNESSAYTLIAKYLDLTAKEDE